MPERIRLSRAKGWRIPENTVKVDRTTPWGNPFITGKHGDRAYCADLYCALLAGLLPVSKNEALFEAAETARAYVAANLESLRGKNLACWCPLPAAGEPDICHAAVLLKLANA